MPFGATVRFGNRDNYDHHVRSVPGGPLGSIAPAKDFEFRLAASKPGSEPSAELKMDAPGAITLGCHIHGSMRAHIYVNPTPWVAVTDASGRALLPKAPDGAGELRLWHPDLPATAKPLEQPLTVPAGGATLTVPLPVRPAAKTGHVHG